MLTSFQTSHGKKKKNQYESKLFTTNSDRKAGIRLKHVSAGGVYRFAQSTLSILLCSSVCACVLVSNFKENTKTLRSYSLQDRFWASLFRGGANNHRAALSLGMQSSIHRFLACRLVITALSGHMARHLQTCTGRFLLTQLVRFSWRPQSSPVNIWFWISIRQQPSCTVFGTETWACAHLHAKLGIYQREHEQKLRSALTSSLGSCTHVSESAWTCGATRRSKSDWLESCY